jgi:hypothetical protein
LRGRCCADAPVRRAGWAAPVFDRLALGWKSYPADRARTLWFDDVVLAREPVGCPR